jgi:predicted dithiol-disulfide oxidoreductase (DUF899 family)
MSNVTDHRIVSHEEWIANRKALLVKEKEFNRLRDDLSAQRRDLPWERVTKQYAFDGPGGAETLEQLFDGRSQLVVYHAMFDPKTATDKTPYTTDAACKACSFWMDNFERVVVHLAHRDVTLIAASRAPVEKLEAYKKRMGWTVRWVSSLNNDFNFDYGVSFQPDEKAKKYNLDTATPYGQENPGLSAFRMGDDGAVYRTYSTYARGLDVLNGTYHLLDMTSKGRDEDPKHPMAWVKRHDRY